MDTATKKEFDIDSLRNGFDTLFLGKEITEKEQELFDALGIGDFATIYMSSKKHGFAVSQKVLMDIVKLSFVIYGNMDNLPLQKKVLLPDQDGKYKFIIANDNSLHKWIQKLMNTEEPEVDILEETNTIAFVSTGDDAHATIASKCGIWGDLMQSYVFGGARIDINRQDKTIEVSADSGSYGSCSNEIVKWMLDDYKKDWYKIVIDMDHQREFFKEE